MNISNQVVDRLAAGTAANRAAIVRLAAGVSTNHVRLANLNARLEVLNRQLEAQRELDNVYDVLRNIMEDNNFTLIDMRQSIGALLARSERVDSSNVVEERETDVDQ